MKTIQEIKNEFEQILSDVSSISGVASDSAVQIATAILHESGKFQRTQMLQGNNRNNNSRNNNQPATEPQKYTLKKHGIEFSDDISKAEASALLDKVMPKKGRENPASSSHY